jgi:uncharacterized membrane protein
MLSLLGANEVAAVRDAAAAGTRLDGRGLLELPAVEVATGVVAQAAGSSLTRMGGTEVLVGVKVRPRLPRASPAVCSIKGCVASTVPTLWARCRAHVVFGRSVLVLLPLARGVPR